MDTGKMTPAHQCFRLICYIHGTFHLGTTLVTETQTLGGIIQHMYDIFISYRHFDKNSQDSGLSIARAVKAELDKKFTVFLDNSDIKDDEFDKVILDAIGSSKICLLLLSRDALIDCARAGDWVARELRAALSNDCKIIPVCPDGSFKAWPADFPQDLSSIKGIQISEISMGQLFEKSMDKLVEDRIAPVIWNVSSVPVKEDVDVHGESLSSRVRSVFSPDPAVGIKQYHLLFISFEPDLYKKKVEETTSVLNGLSQIMDVDSKDIRRTLFTTLIPEFRKELNQAQNKNIERLLYLLGDMLVFYHLRQEKVVKALKKSVSEAVYQESFWQKNGGDIMEWGGALGGLLLGILSGGKVNAGAMMKVGNSSGRSGSQDLKEKKKLDRKRFALLKEAISALRFRA